MEYPIANLTEEKEQKLKQLESELGVILIAYAKDDQETNNRMSAYVDDPNVNLL